SFFCTDTSTTEIYTLSLHDALPISCTSHCPDRYQNRQNPLWHLSMRKAHMSRLYQYEPSAVALRSWPPLRKVLPAKTKRELSSRSEEHTSELQSRENLVCRLLLEKK